MKTCEKDKSDTTAIPSNITVIQRILDEGPRKMGYHRIQYLGKKRILVRRNKHTGINTSIRSITNDKSNNRTPYTDIHTLPTIPIIENNDRRINGLSKNTLLVRLRPPNLPRNKHDTSSTHSINQKSEAEKEKEQIN